MLLENQTATPFDPVASLSNESHVNKRPQLIRPLLIRDRDR